MDNLQARSTPAQLSPIASPAVYARVAGICYLLIIVLGVFGQIIVRGALIAPDAAVTITNIAESPLLWRFGIIGDIAMHLLDIPVMVILYLLLSPVHKPVALLALGFNVIQTAVLATNKLTLLIPLIMLGNAKYNAAFSAEQISAQIQLLIDTHNYGFGLGLIFFGFACFCYGYLLFKSGYFPKYIGILMAVAGLCYLINSVVLIIAPEVSPFVFPSLGICLIAELSLCLRLLISGVHLPKWNALLKSDH